MMRPPKLLLIGLAVSWLCVPIANAAPSAYGSVTMAQHAYVGTAAAFVGTTVFGGDRLSTENDGAVQVRVGAARLLLANASAAQLNDLGELPSATLLSGTAVFSTANANAFVLHAMTAEIRAETDAPTVAQVSIVNAKELLVVSRRGTVMVSVGVQTQLIPADSAYRVLLPPDTASAPEPGQGPRGAGAGGQRRPPIFTGHSNFVKVAVGTTIFMAIIAIDEALESPDRP
jgi:hypothetical protein